jgi:hypothetical protein
MSASDPLHGSLEELHENTKFQDYLKEFAIADSAHDLNMTRGPDGKAQTTNTFNKFFFDKKLIDIGTPQPNHYNPGINIFDQWDNVTWVSGHNFDSVSIGQSGTFKTRNTDFSYQFKVFKDTDIESILKFIHTVGSPDELSTKHMNLTIDVIKGHFIKSLHNTYENKNYGTINILNVREQLNDAGNRTVYNSSSYKAHINSSRQKRNVILKSLREISKQDIIYPAWTLPRESVRSDFFSNFSLKLSPPNYTSNSITSSLSFLNAQNKLVGNTISLKSSDKNTNSVNSLIPLLEDIYEKVFVKKTLKYGWQDIYFKLLQQKRSGDTLQMLSTLDKTRTFQDYVTNSIGTQPANIPTYFLTNDSWNPLPLGLYFGTNVIYQGYTQETGDYLIVFKRTDTLPEPKNRILRMDESSQEEILEIFDDHVQKHTTFFEKQKGIYYAQFKALTTRPLPSTVDELNSQVSEVLRLSVALALFIKLYTPSEIPEELRDFSNKETRYRNSEYCLQRIEEQRIKQLFSDDDLRTVVSSLEQNTLVQELMSLKFNEIQYIEKKKILGIDYAKQINLLFKAFSSLIDTYFEYMNDLDGWFISLRQSPLIKSSTVSFELKKNFRSIQDAIEVAVYSHLKKVRTSAIKRSRDNSENLEEPPPSSRRKQSDASTISDAMTFRSMLESRSSASTPISFRGGGKKTRRKFIGGGEDLYEEPLRGGELFSEMILEFVRPIALKIAKGQPTESWERTFVIKQLLRAVTNFAQVAPSEMDDLSRWYPVFVDIMRQIVNNTEDTESQLTQLQFMLRIWFETDEFEKIFDLDGTQSWHGYGKMAAEIVLLQAFGPAYIDAMSEDTDHIFDAVVFALEDISEDKAYIDSITLYDTYIIQEPSEELSSDFTESFVKDLEKGLPTTTPLPHPENNSAEPQTPSSETALSIENLMQADPKSLQGGKRRRRQTRRNRPTRI